MKAQKNTTKPYKGFNKGRSWQMEEKDLDRLRHQVPELDVITPRWYFSSNLFMNIPASGTMSSGRSLRAGRWMLIVLIL